MVVTLGLLMAEMLYLQVFSPLTAEDLENKKTYMQVVALPDLALANEAMFIRHRSLTATFELFPDSPALVEYFPSTFTYKYSNTLFLTPNRITVEK